MEFCLNINKKDINRNDIVIGSLLGDAHIQKDGRIEIWHSIKQKDYTLWLMNLFSKFFKVYYKERTCKFGKNILLKRIMHQDNQWRSMKHIQIH